MDWAYDFFKNIKYVLENQFFSVYTHYSRSVNKGRISDFIFHFNQLRTLITDEKVLLKRAKKIKKHIKHFEIYFR